ncbi:MAG TPA: HAD family hydrolase [Tepidiformaceae bacterium]|nr:HAD family hydrolase [Tepidiformaceae bacterium]
MTKAVLFDLGDTLFGLNPMHDVTEAFASFLVAEGLEDAETEALRTLESLRERLMAGYAVGQLDEPSIAELVRPFIGSGDFAARAAEHLDHLLGEADVARWEARDRSVVLGAIRDAGLPIGFVSNTLTAPNVMRRRLAEFGLLEFAGPAVFSVEQRVRKPNPAIYRAALEQLGVAPEDVLFVGDRVREDVRGPQALGMRSVLTHEFRQEDPADSNPLAVIAALDDLLKFLD